jgi:hypothetical protein
MASIIPFLIWKLTPESWHIYFEILTVLLFLGAIYLLIRYIRVEQAEVAAMPSRSEYHWPPGWTVTQYSRALLTFLKMRSWRVEMAQAAGPDRLLLGLQRDRRRITMLCIRPGLAATPKDLSDLETMRQHAGTYDSVLVTDSPRHQPHADTTDHQPILLSYEALDDLATELDGGTEEEIRNAAARALEDAEVED